MPSTQASITRIRHVDDTLLGNSDQEFLHNLGGPAWIDVPGRDMTIRRAIVTLLHGNEPSGLKAVRRMLMEKIQPATHLGILVASVDAALHQPTFSHRYIPGERDLNRCFAPPYRDEQAMLASNILEALHNFEPDAVVDTHNTSSHSEPFCVAFRKNHATMTLAGQFAGPLIVLNQSLGTLLEYANPDVPVVTVEFGGFMDPNSDSLAWQTLLNFATRREFAEPTAPLRLLENPVRLETCHDLDITYSSSINESTDLTMINTIDQLNFRKVPAGTTLGWYNHKQELRAVDGDGHDVFTESFEQHDGLLATRKPMTIFMATTDPSVANNDCLLYFTS